MFDKKAEERTRDLEIVPKKLIPKTELPVLLAKTEYPARAEVAYAPIEPPAYPSGILFIDELIEIISHRPLFMLNKPCPL